MVLDDSILDQQVDYPQTYSPDFLDPIPRKLSRASLMMDDRLGFYGVDYWGALEFSWLNSQRMPVYCFCQIMVPCDSAFLVESKSLKYYLNSFYQTVFDHQHQVQDRLVRDLSACLKAKVMIHLVALSDMDTPQLFSGHCLDRISLKEVSYETVTPDLLRTGSDSVHDCLYTDLFRSVCPVTGQPDWASIQWVYEGKAIDHDGLLGYVLSFRNHPGFHEHCVERMFMDILRRCEPSFLSVYACFNRRGGIFINPFRSTKPEWDPLTWHIRQ